jgi:hypothetical protein
MQDLTVKRFEALLERRQFFYHIQSGNEQYAVEYQVLKQTNRTFAVAPSADGIQFLEMSRDSNLARVVRDKAASKLDPTSSKKSRSHSSYHRTKPRDENGKKIRTHRGHGNKGGGSSTKSERTDKPDSTPSKEGGSGK